MSGVARSRSFQSVDTAALQPARDFLKFVNASPTPFHAVAESVSRMFCPALQFRRPSLTGSLSLAVGLEAAGFKRLTERDSWAGGKLAEGGKYFVTRNQSSIIAFTVPPKLDRSAVGMSIVGCVRRSCLQCHQYADRSGLCSCHTDSPRFIIKPVSKRERGGFAEIGVET